MDQKKKITRRKVILGGLAAAGGLVLGDVFWLEPRALEVVRFPVEIDDLPPAFEGYRIAQLSDVHLGNWISPQFVAHAVQTAMNEDPDLLVFTGDFHHKGEDALDDLGPSFSAAAAKDGVYGVLGNHDHWNGADHIADRIHSDTPIKLLRGERVMISRDGQEIALAGLDDLRNAVHDYEGVLAGLPDKTPQILLQHQPDMAEEIDPKYRVDLMLSGHMHGGQLRVPFMSEWFLPSEYGTKFIEGMVQGKGCRVYVNRGIGGIGPGRPRLKAMPEVTILELTARA